MLLATKFFHGFLRGLRGPSARHPRLASPVDTDRPRDRSRRPDVKELLTRKRQRDSVRHRTLSSTVHSLTHVSFGFAALQSFTAVMALLAFAETQQDFGKATLIEADFERHEGAAIGE